MLLEDEEGFTQLYSAKTITRLFEQKKNHGHLSMKVCLSVCLPLIAVVLIQFCSVSWDGYLKVWSTGKCFTVLQTGKGTPVFLSRVST